MADDRDPFDVLGIEPSADENAIKAAYRAAVKACHPDVDGSPQAKAKFLEVSRAFEILKDPVARAEAARSRHPAPGNAFDSVFDFLDKHGRGTERRPLRNKKRGGDRHVVLKVTLEQAFSGGQVVVPGASGKCQQCDGVGTVPTRQRPECPDCGGFGYTRIVHGYTSVQTDCRTCRGCGVVDFVSCRACGGAGSSDRERTVIEIPPGCDEGYTVTVKGRGDPGRDGGPSGDLVVTIGMAEHERFKRAAEHLESTLVVPIWDLARGCKADLVGVDGRRMSIVVPQGAQPGSRLSLRGQGMPAYPGRGNLVVILKAAVPPASTPEIQAAYAALESVCSARTKVDKPV